MTEISFDRYRERYIFDCAGHTGYGASGSDILCSAVSILCYTLREYLTGAEAEGSISAFTSDFREGSVHMEFDCECDTTLRAVNAVLGGFVLLCESFPDYIDAQV